MANAEPIELRIDEKGMGVIEVSGPHRESYQELRTKAVEYLVWARGDMPQYTEDGGSKLYFQFGSGGQTLVDEIYDEWTKYKVSTPFPDERLKGSVRLSPIKLCNDRLKQTTGAARDEFLFRGVKFNIANAFPLHVKVVWSSQEISVSDDLGLPVTISCLPLDQSPLRTTLRIEPMKNQLIGKFLCPTELKLRGYVGTHDHFYGKSIFVGPHYLSAITDLNIQRDGSRNVSATYTMNWNKNIDGFTTAPGQESRKQKLTFRFNVSRNNKVLSAAEETTEVSCAKIAAKAPTAAGGMTTGPAD